ncbi:RNA polymerase sigma factor [Streptomonospora litoralis]|uniref:RNA polymerase sigma factor SigM n=1 Tax=Streptomonospora litoralis TaxID=2498135 RepID=A0A4P6Q912_9ACTN|nr:sigma-70 family RNA polymerase sigma factor [Streptomonospora litoralis]QBI55779.1 RNA polymerase sigma factor SigM [Streptomonospora litoralis]
MAGEHSRRAGPREAARDPEVFEEFYRRHIDAVTRFVARRVEDPHTAADLTADVFLAVVDSAHTFRPELGNESAWLFGIARNVVSAERRRAAREADSGSRIAGRRLLESDDIGRLEERILAEGEARRLLRSLAELPEGERQVIELVAVDQLTVTEAAAALGIRKVTARVRLYRARKFLRAGMGERAEEPADEPAEGLGQGPAQVPNPHAAPARPSGQPPVRIAYAREAQGEA